MKAKHPWRLDTNARYRDVIKMIFGLTTASLLLPVFFARDFLSIQHSIALKDVFTTSIYLSWGFFILSILFSLLFHYFSASWIRLAWEQPTKFFWFPVKDNLVEICLDITFWGSIFSFLGGLILLISFFLTFSAMK
jgi:hypothetical protein